jgi:hypothetical protein
MATNPEEGRPGGTPSDRRPDAHSNDTALPDATRRFDPVVPDADADDATVRLGQSSPENAVQSPAQADEEALRWDGDDVTERLAPAGATVAGGARSGAASGSALLIVYGALGGIYLLMTIGWVATALRFQPTSDDPLGSFMERLASVLAVVAPAAWFAIAYWLSRGRAPWLRLLWIGIGILFVAPWQLVTGNLP